MFIDLCIKHSVSETFYVSGHLSHWEMRVVGNMKGGTYHRENSPTSRGA